MELRILSAEDVERSLSMREAIALMRTAFAQLSAGQVTVPQRLRLDTRDGCTLFMPAYLRQTGDCCVKVVSVYGGNSARGLPSVTGIVVVLDSETGLPLALLDAQRLTSLRSGAAGGLAADLLARKDARTVALFGAGEHARAQLQGVLAVRRVERVYLFSRTRASAERLAAAIASWPGAPAVELVGRPGDAVRRADIVIAATTSNVPVFDGADLRPGTHVTGVGSYTPQMREVDETTVRRSRVIVDSREAALTEAGDLIQAGVSDVFEIGEILTGKAPGRQDDEEITFFKSVGVAAQDAAASRGVLERAERLGLGKRVVL